ncbi:ATP-dependent helicase [Pseudorhodoferax soli]|uniref:ATP-dependent helicase n=1 Tax=Pseudorhodoferax soli TaxID=545864 RepID=UPI001FE4AACA|nr:ATP-dependent helicase [Pseudorhodoferax soli]
MTLEPNALRAVKETDRCLALTAGPGAGKTEMLAQRADFLLRTGACRYPQRILAISFKVDASRNLKERARERCGPDLVGRLDSHTFHAFAKRVIDRFRTVLTGTDALDADYRIGTPRIARRQILYEDLVPLAVQILTNCVVARNAIRQTYDHVFLDEFQDCTGQQYQLVRLAFRGTGAQLTAVGDTKQRIMGWAGALEGVFKTFAQDFDAGHLHLYQNFRSLPRLRRMQNAMVKVMDPQAAVSDATLIGNSGEVTVAPYADSQREAEGLAEKIRVWTDEEGVAASEIAVLISKQPELYADRLMAELARRGIAFRNEQVLQDLCAEPASRLVVDYLAVVMGNREPDAYSRLMGVLLSTGHEEGAAYAVHARWHRFIDEARERARRSRLNAAAMRETAVAFLTLMGRDALAALSADYEQGARLEEVIALTFDRIDELIRLGNDPLQAVSRFSEDSAVRIMTIHKSKGLEFDTVVMLGVEAQTYWSNVASERSAYFVGISRAKRRLLLTVSGRRHRPAGANRWDEARTPHAEFLDYAKAAL